MEVVLPLEAQETLVQSCLHLKGAKTAFGHGTGVAQEQERLGEVPPCLAEEDQSSWVQRVDALQGPSSASEWEEPLAYFGQPAWTLAA